MTEYPWLKKNNNSSIIIAYIKLKSLSDFYFICRGVLSLCVLSVWTLQQQL